MNLSKKDLKIYIANDNSKTVLSYLIGLEKEERITDAAILLMARLTRLNNDKSLEIIGYEEYQRLKNKINFDTLRLVNQISTQQLISNIVFRKEELVLLINPRDFFTENRKKLLDVDIERFEGFDKLRTDFFHNDSLQIQLIRGKRGYGKTHLLRQIADFATSYFSQIYVLQLLTDDPTEILKNLIRQLPKKEPILLLKDDLDKSIEHLNPLLIYLTQNHHAKLIATTGNVGLFDIEQSIRFFSIEPKPRLAKTLDVPEWSEENLIQLLRLSANGQMIKYEKSIIRNIPSPDLIVEKGKQLTGLSSNYDLYKDVATNILIDSQILLSKTIEDKKRINQLTVIIAFLVPFDRHEQPLLIEFIAERLKLDKKSIKEAIESLTINGILRELAYKIRFDSDVKGYFLLADYIEKNAASTLEVLITDLLNNFNEKRIITNVIAAFRNSERQTEITKVLENILDRWINESEKISGQLISSRVLLLRSLVDIPSINKRIIELTFTYLKETERINRAINLDDSIFDYRISLNTYAPFVLSLIPILDKRESCLAIIQELHERKLTSYADNYKTTALVSDANKFFNNNIGTYEINLSFINAWLSNEKTLELAITSLKTILFASHEQTDFVYNTTTLSDKIVPYHEDLNKIRWKAIEIVAGMLGNDSQQLYAMEILQNLGKGKRLHHEELTNWDINRQIKKERAFIIPKLGTLLLNTDDFEKQYQINSIFTRWWLLSLTDDVVPYLLKFKKDELFLVLTYASYRFRQVDSDFENLYEREKRENPKDRWKWFWAAKKEEKDNWDLGWMYFKKLGERIAKSYNTTSETIEFFERIHTGLKEQEEKNGNVGKHEIYQIIHAWVDSNSAIFKEIINDEHLKRKIPTEYHGYIKKALLEKEELSVQEYAKEIINLLPNVPKSDLHVFLFHLRNESESFKNEVIDQIIKKGEMEDLVTLAKELRFLYKENLSKGAEILLSILEKDFELKEIFFGYDIGFLLEDLFKNEKELDKEIYEQLQNEISINIKIISILNHNFHDALNFAVRSIDDFIEIIEYRLINWKLDSYRSKTKPYTVIHPLPTELTYTNFIKNKINDFDDYKTLINAVHAWREKYPIVLSHQFKKLYKAITRFKFDKNNEFAILDYIEEKEKLSETNEVIRLSQYIPRDEETHSFLIGLWNRILSKKGEELVDGIISKWYNTPGTRTGWNGSMEYSDKALFENLYNLIEPSQYKLKRILKKYYDYALERVRDYEKRSEDDHLR
ncbi:MAG: hypothetical protein AAF806_05610 [Bacteroidota bacterium]